MKINFKIFYVLLLFLFACTKQNSNIQQTPTSIDFAKGADVSWVTQMEASGYKFYDANGVQQDCFQLLKSLGINSIRLRVWVNPANGWCNTADIVAKSIRAKNAGMRIMIDFHYSDTWADPGHQAIPVAWTGQNIAALDSSVYHQTFSVLTSLKYNGIIPTWVQIGNETNDGMLWETGRASINMANFASLINSGYNAVKSIDTSIKVIVHISNGYDNNLFRWVFDGLKSNAAKWDMIGMSLYPSTSNWLIYNTQCLANMNDMVLRYGKSVMVCEVGMNMNAPDTCYAFLTDLISKVRSNNGMGVFYWEPQCYNWQGYSMGAFDTTGKPTSAMKAFSN